MDIGTVGNFIVGGIIFAAIIYFGYKFVDKRMGGGRKGSGTVSRPRDGGTSDGMK